VRGSADDRGRGWADEQGDCSLSFFSMRKAQGVGSSHVTSCHAAPRKSCIEASSAKHYAPKKDEAAMARQDQRRPRISSRGVEGRPAGAAGLGRRFPGGLGPGRASPLNTPWSPGPSKWAVLQLHRSPRNRQDFQLVYKDKFA